MVQVKMKKKDATVYCNLLRHAALYNRRVVRPVAFRVNNACNLLCMLIARGFGHRMQHRINLLPQTSQIPIGMEVISC